MLKRVVLLALLASTMGTVGSLAADLKLQISVPMNYSNKSLIMSSFLVRLSKRVLTVP